MNRLTGRRAAGPGPRSHGHGHGRSDGGHGGSRRSWRGRLGQGLQRTGPSAVCARGCCLDRPSGRRGSRCRRAASPRGPPPPPGRRAAAAIPVPRHRESAYVGCAAAYSVARWIGARRVSGPSRAAARADTPDSEIRPGRIKMPTLVAACAPPLGIAGVAAARTSSSTLRP
jgi:hypothetical protein